VDVLGSYASPAAFSDGFVAAMAASSLFVGWFLLLGLAAGESGAALDTKVGQMLTDRGWRTEGSSGVNASDARRGSQTTLDALQSMAGGHQAIDPALVTRLARATLLGVTNAQ